MLNKKEQIINLDENSINNNNNNNLIELPSESSNQSKQRKNSDKIYVFLNEKRKKTFEHKDHCAKCKLKENLLECKRCPRCFHEKCLKYNIEFYMKKNIFYCPKCLQELKERKKESQIKYENNLKNLSFEEREKRRILRNANLREWRRKKKEEIKNLMELNKKKLLKIKNSKICIDFTYSNVNNQIKSLNLPILYPIPNDLLINSKEKIDNLNKILNNNKIENKLLNFYLDQKNNNNQFEYNKNFNRNETLNKILQTHNSINALNNLIKNSPSNLLLYNKVLRVYYKKLLRKKKKKFNFPINDKELYSFPDFFNLSESFYNKPEGENLPNDFNEIINLFDFFQSFNENLFISKFDIKIFYSAIKYSNEEKNEINVINSVHIGLILFIFQEIKNINNNEIKEGNFLLIKIIIESYKNNLKGLYKFLLLTWPEILNIFFNSNYFKNKIQIFDEKIENISKKFDDFYDINSYNSIFNYEEKIFIIKILILFIYNMEKFRQIIKENQENLLEIEKKRKEILRNYSEFKKTFSEIQKKENEIKPNIKILEIDKKIENIYNECIGFTRREIEQMRKKYNDEKKEMIKFNEEIEKYENENKKHEEKLKEINFQFEKKENLKLLGKDYRNFKYYFFPWIQNKIFIKYKNNNQILWKEIFKQNDLNNLVEKLSEKGINEKKLKININKILSNFNNDFEQSFNLNIKNNNYINYINKNSLVKIENNNKEKIEILIEKLNILENKITNYLNYDNKEWESNFIRNKIISWFNKVKNIQQYSKLLIMFNERVKLPYKLINNKIDENNENNNNKMKKNNLINDDDSELNYNKDYNPIVNDELIDPYILNPDLDLVQNKTRLYNKEFDNLKIEFYLIEYLKKINKENICKIFFGLSIFEGILNDLCKRREQTKRKNEELINESKEYVNSNKIKQNNNNNNNIYLNEIVIQEGNVDNKIIAKKSNRGRPPKHEKKKSLRNTSRKNYYEDDY